tara:strand:- start:36 stop:230 length:195 start_codon:yes stop_codon:yes gene_type:complete
LKKFPLGKIGKKFTKKQQIRKYLGKKFLLSLCKKLRKNKYKKDKYIIENRKRPIKPVSAKICKK